MHPEIRLLDENVRPRPGDEFLLADDLAGAFDQSVQNVECPTAEPNGCIALQQHALRRKEPERPESEDLSAGVRRIAHSGPFTPIYAAVPIYVGSWI